MAETNHHHKVGKVRDFKDHKTCSDYARLPVFYYRFLLNSQPAIDPRIDRTSSFQAVRLTVGISNRFKLWCHRLWRSVCKGSSKVKTLTELGGWVVICRTSGHRAVSARKPCRLALNAYTSESIWGPWNSKWYSLRADVRFVRGLLSRCFVGRDRIHRGVVLEMFDTFVRNLLSKGFVVHSVGLYVFVCLCDKYGQAKAGDARCC